jgi:hypothetical protein
MGQMDKVTQANASAAEEYASAAEELSSQAGHLSEVVAAFAIVRETKTDGNGMSDVFSGNDINLLKQMLSQSALHNTGRAPSQKEQRKLAFVGAAKSHKGNNGKNHSEPVIPMDDEDFSSF